MQPYPTPPTSLSLTLVPICSLSRANVPLAWLDMSSTSSLFPSTTLCELDQSDRGPIRDHDATIVLVKNRENGEMFALEQLDREVHVAVKLADWVTDGMVKSAAALLPQPSLLQRVLAAQAMANRLQGNTLRDATDAMPLPLQAPRTKQPKMKKGALARQEILPKRDTPELESARTIAVPIAQPRASSVEEVQKQPLATDRVRIERECDSTSHQRNSIHASPPAPQPDAGMLQQSCHDVQETMENLHTKYLETLYVSKTSVAYFAKGPLARARAAFSNSDEHGPLELSEFYRDHVLPLKKLDLKFKDSLLACVRAFSDEGPSQTKRRRKSKTKLGKDGLYPDEHDFIKQWWQRLGPQNAEYSSGAVLQQMNTMFTDLRSRETQLQILIILEAMILELPTTTIIKKETTEPDMHDVPTKKKQDLKMHLDLLVDRLCIWHTVAFDDFSDDKQPGKKTNDKLRDFCVEVIVPFYASKLPEKCKALCKKLGGPSELSPKRPRTQLTKSMSTSKVMPGADMKRLQPPPPKLQRALTDNFTRSRSPSMPLLKREASERPASRGGIQKNRLLENRQVDLVAVARQQESKLKKLNALSDQKKQLDDAISMLRKPNRGVVAKEIVGEAERRQDARSNTSRLGKNPARTAGVQVTATPRKKKPGDTQLESPEALGLVAPEVSAIPSSTVRPSLLPEMPATRRDPGIQETPSRRAASISERKTLPTQQYLLPPSGSWSATTPTKVSKAASPLSTFAAASPTACRSSPDEPLATITNTPLTARLRMTKSHRAVSFTPLKKSDSVVMNVFASAPEVEKKPTNADDIYARLGWMDDGFDL